MHFFITNQLITQYHARGICKRVQRRGCKSKCIVALVRPPLPAITKSYRSEDIRGSSVDPLDHHQRMRNRCQTRPENCDVGPTAETGMKIVRSLAMGFSI